MKNTMMKNIIIANLCSFLMACSHTNRPPIPLEEHVDLNRFMGDWYVIANIPTFIEKDAHNAIENYQMNEDGSINTTFTFFEGHFKGELKTFNPTGYVSEDNNSIWGMQFLWPIKAEFIIAYLSDDYQNTIIARNARDYIWIMSRSPEVDSKTYEDLIKFSKNIGYQPELIQRVPQNWSDNPPNPDNMESKQ